jgi:hypothetical protein
MGSVLASGLTLAAGCCGLETGLGVGVEDGWAVA